MTPEQEWIISNCSPIVQHICSSKYRGIVIPPLTLTVKIVMMKYSDDFEEDSDSSEHAGRISQALPVQPPIFFSPTIHPIFFSPTIHA